MASHSPISPNPHPPKRQRQSSAEPASPPSPGHDHDQDGSPTNESVGDGPASSLGGGKAGQSSSFRNVSACNRCRLRKNRCDQKLPSCASCAKAGVACVGYDPITKKEIPRSYVFYLETRIEQLEALLSAHGIAFPPAEDLESCSRGVSGAAHGAGGAAAGGSGTANAAASSDSALARSEGGSGGAAAKKGAGMASIVSPSKPRSLASASGVSFARVVYAAVQYSVSDQQNNGNGAARAATPMSSDRVAAAIGGRTGGTSMRDSFFGLHTKPTILPAPFPDREVADRLVSLYFEHANPQIPILHRPEFMRMLEQAYAPTPPSGKPGGPVRGPRELYMLNMVFAIGCGVIVGEPVKSREDSSRMTVDQDPERAGQAQPEEYHASAIVHLEACLSNSGGSLDVLQAVLLLANFALLRPVPPGLWYIIGVAVRLAVDLGLHYEDGSGVDLPEPPGIKLESGRDRDAAAAALSRERGRRLWIRDMRRRLWWCTYSFDRLVSVCVGRPFGISDQVITTEFPTLLDDKHITPTGFLAAPPPPPPVAPSPGGDSPVPEPSYKYVAYHYFKFRLLQSEILQVLQHNLAQSARARGQNAANASIMHGTQLPSPFLARFDSFRSWRVDIDRRLWEWQATAPPRAATGVQFATEFLELNYWQAIIVLYRQSLSVPALFEGEYDTSNEVDSPSVFATELHEDEDRVYLKVAEAGQRILRIYRQLHLNGLVSYIYLTTHHLFMAGIAYLYAIWHSPIVRSRLTMDEVDFTILAAKSVFSDLIDKCPPAEACRDAFDRTAKATIKMANSNGGFGAPLARAPPRRAATRDSTGPMDWAEVASSAGSVPSVRRRPHPSLQRPAASAGPGGPAFGFDIDGLSSPAMSNAGELSSMGSPPLPRLNVAGSFGQGVRSAPSPSEMALSAASDAGAVPSGLEQGLLPSPTVGRRPGGLLSGAEFGGGAAGAPEFPDLQSLEFLQGLGPAGANGVPGGDEFGGLEQAQLDLGFGINWEGGHHDFSDGQQINIFDGFFFGGQQGGLNGGGGMSL